MAFIPTADAVAAREFYENKLGLKFISDDQFALVFQCNGAMLRVVRTPKFSAAPFTIFGWQVEDIAGEVRQLTARGLHFERYGGFEQDAQGIWTSPGGARVAWLRDPDGNILSVSQH